jgi:hypothetical protein
MKATQETIRAVIRAVDDAIEFRESIRSSETIRGTKEFSAETKVIAMFKRLRRRLSEWEARPRP